MPSIVYNYSAQAELKSSDTLVIVGNQRTFLCYTSNITKHNVVLQWRYPVMHLKNVGLSLRRLLVLKCNKKQTFTLFLLSGITYQYLQTYTCMPIKLTTSTITCLYFLNYQRNANCTSILTNHRCYNQRLCNSRRVCCTRLEHHVRQFTLYWEKTNLHEISRVSMIMEESLMTSCCHIFEMGLYHNKISR